MIRAEFWGDMAVFSRPELKVERVSYDVITPSAARGMLEAIYFHPGMRYFIDKIYVCSPIAFTSVRRNEVKSKILASEVRRAYQGANNPMFLDTPQDIQQRATTALKNVRYVIEAHFAMTDKANPSDNPGKFQDILKRRLRKGQCYTTPYLGCREFPAQFGPCEEIPPCPPELLGEKDLGFMLWDLDYTDPQNIQPLFFRAKLNNGILCVPERNSGEVYG